MGLKCLLVLEFYTVTPTQLQKQIKADVYAVEVRIHFVFNAVFPNKHDCEQSACSSAVRAAWEKIGVNQYTEHQLVPLINCDTKASRPFP